LNNLPTQVLDQVSGSISIRFKGVNLEKQFLRKIKGANGIKSGAEENTGVCIESPQKLAPDEWCHPKHQQGRRISHDVLLARFNNRPLGSQFAPVLRAEKP
jgi:hypothetical protein